MKKPIYLDYNATTPIEPEVIAFMQELLNDDLGNPSSSNYYGLLAKQRIETARQQIAELINCSKDEIIFTSGATEANNIAIRGIAWELKQKGKHIITSAIEHPSVVEVCRYLEKNGFNISRIPVDEYGIIQLNEIKKHITDETILITVMHSNNETGSVQPISEIAEIALEKGIMFHSDAAQSAGKIKVDVQELGVNLLSLAGHKFYAPKGVGALYIKKGTPLTNIMFGAGQEKKIRPGTENVLALAALGKAAVIASDNLVNNQTQMKVMRERLYQGLKDSLTAQGVPADIIKLNGHPELRLPNTLNISIKGVNGTSLNDLVKDKIAFSCGAACHSGTDETSSVLSAMGVPHDYIKGAVRLSTGRKTTEPEIDEAVEVLTEHICRLLPEAAACSINSTADNKKTLDEIKLTHYTAGLGCACKIQPSVLEAIVKQMPVFVDENILIGPENSDDAAIYKIDDDKAIVLTVDFFNPIVDDPRQFGAIAAANSLSDIYAMGATPLFALNIVGFPVDTLPTEVLTQILAGGIEKANEAGIPILGGHSVKDVEPKYGLVVAGIIHPDKILANNTARVGDAIVLTKPIGVGIISSALKKGLASEEQKITATETMATLNKYAAEILRTYKISSCTDVTGFGLLGHFSEVVIGSGVEAVIYADSVPRLAGLDDLIAKEVTPGGIFSNMDYFEKNVIWGNEVTENDKYILFDAQTSGGLLITMPEEDASKYVVECRQKGLLAVSMIGNILSYGTGKIKVEKSDK